MRSAGGPSARAASFRRRGSSAQGFARRGDPSRSAWDRFQTSQRQDEALRMSQGSAATDQEMAALQAAARPIGIAQPTRPSNSQRERACAARRCRRRAAAAPALGRMRSAEEPKRRAMASPRAST
eukprot:scaffold32058_cov65-Phaeocystis_antarctica.AAC.2